MTMRLISPAEYVCDGCKLRAIAWDSVPPRGWTRSDPAKYPHGTTHYCSPECVPPEPTK